MVSFCSQCAHTHLAFQNVTCQDSLMRSARHGQQVQEGACLSFCIRLSNRLYDRYGAGRIGGWLSFISVNADFWLTGHGDGGCCNEGPSCGYGGGNAHFSEFLPDSECGSMTTTPHNLVIHKTLCTKFQDFCWNAGL